MGYDTPSHVYSECISNDEWMVSKHSRWTVKLAGTCSPVGGLCLVNFEAVNSAAGNFAQAAKTDEGNFADNPQGGGATACNRLHP